METDWRLARAGGKEQPCLFGVGDAVRVNLNDLLCWRCSSVGVGDVVLVNLNEYTYLSKKMVNLD